MIKTEFHWVDGSMKEIPVQCDKCEGYTYYNGVKQVCRKHIDKDGNMELVCAGHLCDDWKWCGF